MPSIKAAVGTLIVVILLSDCSTGYRSVAFDGPLKTLGGPVRLCVTSDRSRAVTVGSDVLSNSGSQPLIIDSLHLRAGKDLTLAGAFLVPIEGKTLLGDGFTFPPVAGQVQGDGVRWDLRVNPVGATLRPGPQYATPGKPAPMNLVIGLVSGLASGGAATGVEIDYHIADQKFVATSGFALTVRNQPDSCARGGY